MTPPSDSKYVKIKSELIKRLSASQEEKTHQLLERVEIGDRKPSQFLRHLQNLTDFSVPETLLKTLWMGRLPKSIRVALAIVKDSKLEELAVHADNIADASGPLLPQIAKTSRSDTLEAMLNLKISQLTLSINQEIATLRSEVAAINTRPSRNPDQVLTAQDFDLGAVLSMVEMDYAGIIGVMDHNRENAKNLVPIIRET
jgi:hypothetical protein